MPPDYRAFGGGLTCVGPGRGEFRGSDGPIDWGFGHFNQYFRLSASEVTFRSTFERLIMGVRPIYGRHTNPHRHHTRSHTCSCNLDMPSLR